MQTIHIETGKGWSFADAEHYGEWSVHLTDDIAKERYSVSHRGAGRYVIQDLSHSQAAALADVLSLRYPRTDGSDPRENRDIVEFCKMFVSQESRLRRRSLSRRRAP